jgi:hypothetical protein
VQAMRGAITVRYMVLILFSTGWSAGNGKRVPYNDRGGSIRPDLAGPVKKPGMYRVVVWENGRKAELPPRGSPWESIGR